MSPINASLGSRTFLAIEKKFNLIFNDRLNPFYHLGAIAYFLFWLVVATGLYLYAFFETSVLGAYASVETITHGHFYVGGVIRSLHRYASDALVLVVLLHMLRHFSFGRFRGFRWLSWLTGLLILWLTYASGINGYMLPWDRLSQFVVTASTEWIDVLPVIGGSMTRNFISNANVSDRLFSLLSFIHIGLPLSMLALLWVHTQRVPHAQTLPPRPIMWGAFYSLSLLSLLLPAVSQAPADMSSLTQTLAFDWFYLPSYALIGQWGPVNTWLVVGGLTLLMALLPWMPQRFEDQAAAWQLSALPDERIILVRAGETLLDAGLREGLPMPYECRNGSCGLCKCSLLHGQVQLQAYQPSALSEEERLSGQTLLCCAQAFSDIDISYVPAVGTNAVPAKQYLARVSQLELLCEDVMRVDLRLSNDGSLPFHCGQYLNIILEDGSHRSFSFATAPHAGGDIQLHVRLVAGGRWTPSVFSTMKVGDTLRIEGPKGAFRLQEDGDKPMIFVAGATGFAPIKSMLEHAFHIGLNRRMLLYWGVRHLSDLYLGNLALEWARDHANFTFVPVLSEPRAQDYWGGRTGLVHEAILMDFPSLSEHQIYACGSAQMVEAAYPAFIRHGIHSEDCFSDAFYFSPLKVALAHEVDPGKLGGILA